MHQLWQRLTLRLGRLMPALEQDGAPRSPDYLSRDWRRTVLALDLPQVMVHAPRHSHASALIAAGLDVLTIGHRPVHRSAGFTLTTYMHLFADEGGAAAQVMDAVMGGGARA